MQLPHVDPSIFMAVLSTGTAAKLGMMAARSMPAPPANCNYFLRWFYDFVQQACENQDKVGTSKPEPPAHMVP